MTVDETIEIIQAIDGMLIARVSWGQYRYSIELPSGFEGWKEDEQAAHLRRVVVPRLKFLITKTKVNKLRGIVGDPALHVKDFGTDGITPSKSKARSPKRALLD